MKLKLTPAAIDDIAEIKKYIREEYDNPTAANRIAEKIRKSYKQLKTTPFIGKRLDAVVEVQTDYRVLVCGKYLIFYEAEESIVSIHRVIHGKRDYCRLLFDISFVDDLEDEQE